MVFSDPLTSSGNLTILDSIGDFDGNEVVGGVEPVPEPLTILGSAIGLSFGALMEKRRRQAQLEF